MHDLAIKEDPERPNLRRFVLNTPTPPQKPCPLINQRRNKRLIHLAFHTSTPSNKSKKTERGKFSLRV